MGRFDVLVHMRLSSLLVGAALTLTACGGGSSAVTTPTGDESSEASGPVAPADPASAPATEVAPETAAAAAAANLANLVVADDPRDTGVLVVADGSITTLAEAATGDRPLLLWFWAPH